MKIIARSLLFACSFVLLAACAGSPDKHLQTPPAVSDAITVIGRDSISGQIVGTIMPKSHFAALQIGMTRAEVEQIVGRPTDVAAQSAGIAWVPYYFGSDAWRTESYYKGEGRLVFNTDSRLVLIDVSDDARK